MYFEPNLVPLGSIFKYSGRHFGVKFVVFKA